MTAAKRFPNPSGKATTVRCLHETTDRGVMKTNLFEQKAILGLLIWVAAIAIGVIAMQRSFENSPSSVRQLATYVTYQRKSIQLDAQSSIAFTVGEPIFLANSDRVSPIGKVTSVGGDDSPPSITLFSSSPVITKDDYLKFHYAPDSIDWLVRTMFHPEKTAEIKQIIQDAYDTHRSDLIDTFQPVVRDILADAGQLMQDDIKTALKSRNQQITKIGDRLQNQIVKKELIPLFQKEIWPIIEKEAEPLVSEIGKEIWQEVSLFGFGWRYLYDKSPLPEKKLTEKKFRDFVDSKVKPILEKHSDDLVDLQRRIGSKIAANDAVRLKVNESLKQVMEDDQIQALLIDVFKEVTLDNDAVTAVVKKNLNSPKAQRAMRVANTKLDPAIRKIGIALFGHPSEGITPEFAKVLRRRILRKDRSWLSLHIQSPQENQDRNRPFPDSLKVYRSNDDTSRPYAPAPGQGMP